MGLKSLIRYPKGHVITPSERVSHVDVGQVFSDETGKLFLLVDRNPWHATYVKWHWFNQLRVQGLQEFFKARKAFKESLNSKTS